MSCCKTLDGTAINVESFVLTQPAVVLEMQDETSGVSRFLSQLISRSYKPQPPPPKTSLS
jgi:hypothetical protein